MITTIAADMSENFRWHQGQKDLYSVTLRDLLDESLLSLHLSKLVSDYGSPSKGHAASMTAKRIGYLAALMIYARIKHDITCSLEDCRFITTPEENAKSGWLPLYTFPLEEAKSTGSISDWITKELYTDTLVPAVELLGKEKGISRAVLFENIFTYVKWLFISKMQDEAAFQRLLSLPAGAFGTKKHPLALYETGAAQRKTCCLYYLTEGAAKPCKSCPLQKA